MKKLIFKVVFKFGIIIAVLLAVPYFMMGGQLPPWAASWLPSMTSSEKPASVPKNLTNAVTDEKVTYYRWVDAQGQVHFSSQAPTGEQVEKKTLMPNTNVVQATKIPEPEEEVTVGGRVVTLTKKGGKGGSGSGEDEAFNPYSPEGVQKMFENAQDAAKMMDTRNKELGKITGSASGE